MVLADSKPPYLQSDGNRPACKIVPVKNAFVAVSGMILDPARQFDAEEVAAQTFDSPGNFAAHVKLATERIQAKGSEELSRLRTEDPERYGSALKNGANFIDVLFLAFENHVAMLAARGLHWNETKSKLELHEKHDCPGSACPDGTYLSKIGEVSEVEKFLSVHKRSDLGETVLRDLMVQQAQATPHATGLPIQILSLQDSGPIWLANDLGCPPQK